MRLIKMFGLAAVAAIASMAFIGASSAMATSTVLCKANELACATPNKVENTVVTALAEDSLAHPLLLKTVDAFGNEINVLCLVSHIKLKVLTLAAPLVGHVEELSWLNCGRHGTNHANCTVTTIKNGLLLLLKTGPNTGSLESHETEVLVECGAFIHCVYGGLPVLTATGGTTLAGGTKGKVEANNVVLTKISGFGCPKTSEWRALYFETGPEHAYISE